MSRTFLKKLSAALLFAAIALLPSTAAMQQKGGVEESGPYDVVENWPQPWAKQGYIWGSQPGIFAESPNEASSSCPTSCPAASMASGDRSASVPRRRRPRCATASSSSTARDGLSSRGPSGTHCSPPQPGQAAART